MKRVKPALVTAGVKLINYSDGCKDHFCIGKPMEPGSIFWHFWNDKSQWCSAGTVYIGRRAANAKLRELITKYKA